MLEINLNIRVAVLCDMRGHEEIANKFIDCGECFDKEYQDLTFIVDSYSEDKVEVNIPRAKNVAEVLIPIAEAYKQIAEIMEEEYGAWEDVIGRMWFENLVIHDNGEVKVHIGN